MKTFNDFEILYNESLINKPKHIRVGQLYFNLLYEIHPTLANKIRGSKLDPFYFDEITQPIIDFIKNNW